jgi:hypothetical protein
MTRDVPLFSRRIPRALVTIALSAATSIAITTGPAAAERTPTGMLYHEITFPVAGHVEYSDDFGDCRAGCTRSHQGNDLLGKKLMKEVAASDGTIAWVHDDNTGTAGNMLQLTGNDGWVYWYIHINNDTPGTDDGKNPKRWRLAPGIGVGSKVKAGQFIAYMGDSGDAEGTQPHLHFEVHKPDGTPIDPYTSLRLAQGLPADGLCSTPSNPAANPNALGGHGYWTLGKRGVVRGFGSAKPYPAKQPATPDGAAAVSIAATVTGKGYWLADSAGGVQPFGDARSYGAPKPARVIAPIISIATTPSGKGYWLAGRDGSVYPFGDARSYGSMRGKHLNQPVLAMAPTQSGRGYWLLAKDGGVFTFGDATFFGSTGSRKLNAPIIGMGAATGGSGYWLLASDGGMFSFGKAKFHGSLPGMGWCPGAGTAVAFTSTRTGNGYWVVLTDGRVLAFGDAQHYGDAPKNAPPVAFAVAP